MSRHPPYTPIDYALSLPATRILRVLRWLDWATSAQIKTSADFSEFESIAATKALSRLVNAKYVVRQRNPHGDGTDERYLYQITARGRRRYASLTTVNMNQYLY